MHEHSFDTPPSDRKAFIFGAAHYFSGFTALDEANRFYFSLARVVEPGLFKDNPTESLFSTPICLSTYGSSKARPRASWGHFGEGRCKVLLARWQHSPGARLCLCTCTVCEAPKAHLKGVVRSTLPRGIKKIAECKIPIITVVPTFTHHLCRCPMCAGVFTLHLVSFVHYRRIADPGFPSSGPNILPFNETTTLFGRSDTPSPFSIYY